MEVKTQEIDEEKIEQAVRYALSTSFCLDELSRLLVMEGGVDLDTLARIIRENRGESPRHANPGAARIHWPRVAGRPVVTQLVWS